MREISEKPSGMDSLAPAWDSSRGLREQSILQSTGLEVILPGIVAEHAVDGRVEGAAKTMYALDKIPKARFDRPSAPTGKHG
jgi:hypothetical protein